MKYFKLVVKNKKPHLIQNNKNVSQKDVQHFSGSLVHPEKMFLHQITILL